VSGISTGIEVRIRPFGSWVAVGTTIAYRPPRGSARALIVGIELGRVCCRRRVTTLTLSVARWVHSSAMVTFSEAPPIMPDGRISQVRFEALVSHP
jgi:hypothetical protein